MQAVPAGKGSTLERDEPPSAAEVDGGTHVDLDRQELAQFDLPHGDATSSLRRRDRWLGPRAAYPSRPRRKPATSVAGGNEPVIPELT